MKRGYAVVYSETSALTPDMWRVLAGVLREKHRRESEHLLYNSDRLTGENPMSAEGFRDLWLDLDNDDVFSAYSTRRMREIADWLLGKQLIVPAQEFLSLADDIDAIRTQYTQRGAKLVELARAVELLEGDDVSMDAVLEEVQRLENELHEERLQ